MDAIEASGIATLSMVSTFIESGPIPSSIVAEHMRRLCHRIEYVEVDYIDVIDMHDEVNHIHTNDPHMPKSIIMRRIGIQQLPLGCGSVFKMLKHMDFSYNKITSLTLLVSFLDTCTTLRTLRLRANMLTDTSISTHGDSLSNLTILDVSDNFLTHICLPYISNTRVTNVLADANSIRTSVRGIYTDVHHSPMKRFLSLRGNPIATSEDDDVLHGLLKLKNLTILT